jgi:RNA polymerase sigma-70 factor (ECF subfamily)
LKEIADVKLAQQSDKNAFCRLIKNSEVTMYRVAKSFLQTDEDCADAIQEAIIKAYNSINSLREPLYFKTWLIKILINECRKTLSLRHRVIPRADLTIGCKDTNSFEKIEIQNAVDSLENELRIIVNLFYFEDLSLKTIAQLLSIPEGTVKSRLSRARTQLAKILCLQDEMEGMI